MRIAKIIARIPLPLLYENIAVDAAKDDIVCPEGKEKSVGLGIKRVISGFISHGRILAIKGFNVIFPINKESVNEIAIINPVCLVFFDIKKTIVIIIQITPAFPNIDIYGIILFNIGKCKLVFIKFNIKLSAFCIILINAISPNLFFIFYHNAKFCAI